LKREGFDGPPNLITLPFLIPSRPLFLGRCIKHKTSLWILGAGKRAPKFSWLCP
jgi:hypothetical protein